MSSRHSPLGHLGGSQPNIAYLRDIELSHEEQLSLRKRKNPHNFDPEDFNQKLDETLASVHSNIILDVNKSLADFRENMITILHDMTNKQNESIKQLSEQVCKFNSQINDMKQTCDKIQSEHTNISKDVNLLKSDHVNFKSKLLSLEKELSDSTTTIADLSKQLSFKEQQCRMNNLEISGIPFSKSENLMNIMQVIFTKIGIPLCSSDIDHVHRVRRFPPKKSVENSGQSQTHIPNIIVKFTQRQKKNDTLAAIRARRGLTTSDLNIDGPATPIFVNEHLTPSNKMLYSQTRKIGRECGYAYIWIKDCKIFVRKNEVSKPILISVEGDLGKIK